MFAETTASNQPETGFGVVANYSRPLQKLGFRLYEIKSFRFFFGDV